MLINLLAERAKPEFCKDDMIIAPGKRSAARGNETKNENLPFSCFAPNTFGAKQEKGGLGFCGRFPRTALVPRLSWAIIVLPFQDGRWSLYDIGSMKWIKLNGL